LCPAAYYYGEEMNIQRLFEEMPEVQSMTEEQHELLDRIMNLDNPINFNGDFASDEDLDGLENALDQSEREVPHQIQLKTTILSVCAKVAESDDDFI